MMSYYNTKHPGLAAFITLSAASVLFFAFTTTPPAAGIGILGLLWGIFTFLRALSLLEIMDYRAPLEAKTGASKGENTAAPSLAHDLIKRMDGNQNLTRGLLALHAIHLRSLGWYAIGFVYLCVKIFALLHAETSETVSSTLAREITAAFMIGAVFWAGQTYAYSDRISRLLIALFSTLTALSILINKNDLLNPTPPVPELTAQTILLIILALYSAASLLPTLTKGGEKMRNSIYGIIVLIIITLCKYAIPSPHFSTELWISTWGLFSLFWIRATSGTRKIYRLHLTG